MKELTKAELGNKSHTTRKIKIEEKNCEFSDESEIGGKFEFLNKRLARSSSPLVKSFSPKKKGNL